MFNPGLVDMLANHILQHNTAFNSTGFRNYVVDKEWENKAFKARYEHIASGLHLYLTADFEYNVNLLLSFAQKQATHADGMQITLLFIPHYCGTYGIHSPAIALQFMEQITQFCTCEFAIRPYIIQFPALSFEHLNAWANHSDHRVRRLASEGSRPLLPWGEKLSALYEDPSLVMPLLHKLVQDKHPLVLKSVANHLNDISKKHPEIVINFAKKYYTNCPTYIKHGLRTLLKQSNTQALNIIGVSQQRFDISLELSSSHVEWGDQLRFTVQFKHQSPTPLKCLLYFVMHFKRGNGQYNKKKFHLLATECEGNYLQNVSKSYSFKAITTRKYYAGVQKISVLINGQESETLEFVLKANINESVQV